jgi:hypothetical protein
LTCGFWGVFEEIIFEGGRGARARADFLAGAPGLRLLRYWNAFFELSVARHTRE